MTGRTEEFLYELREVSKYYGAITAIDKVNLRIRPGEVVGLVGDNGAGKSTLMKVLSGLLSPSEGTILFEGNEVRFTSPKAAREMGIEMVYQDFALAGNMSISENIFLGREPGRRFGPLTIIDKAKARRDAVDHLNRLKIHVKSIDQNTEELSGGQRQAVAIARATAFQAKLVLLDEPTAALAINEVNKVLELIRSLKDHGVAVIIISHRMDDIFNCCDRVIALYQGRNFADSQIEKTSRNEVIGWIMGVDG